MNRMQRAVARRYRRAAEEERGFTLIEMLIVILIMGVLAAIVVLGIGAFQGTGEHQACITTWHTVESANAAYYAKNQTWAGAISDLTGAGYLKTTPKGSWGIALTGSDTVNNTCPS